MFATDAPAELRDPIRPASASEADTDGEADELAPARGIVLGAMLGAAGLGLLALAIWLLV